MAKRVGRFSAAMPAAHAWLGFRVRVCCAAADQRYSGHEIAASPPPGCVSSAWTSVRVKRPRPPLGRGLFLLPMPMRRPGHAPRGFASGPHHRDMRRGRDFRPEAGSPAKIGVGLIRPAQRDRFFDGAPHRLRTRHGRPGNGGPSLPEPPPQCSVSISRRRGAGTIPEPHDAGISLASASAHWLPPWLRATKIARCE